mmetsp:Transcript_20900/g.72098  ORF Transcript_20900/g.72098 Transcript_20900/m.72098 type:complete len:121 (-) Transcript_20900:127-489(-)
MWQEEDEASRPALALVQLLLGRPPAAATLDTLSHSRRFGRRTLGGGAPAAEALEWLADADADEDAEPGSDHLRLEPSKKELLVTCKEEDEAARLGSEAKDNGLSELAAGGAGTVETRGRK